MHQTPAVQLPNASLLRRIAAWIYDVFLLFAVAFAYGAIVIGIATALGVEPKNLALVEDGENMTLTGDENYQPFAKGPLFQAGLIAVFVFFYVGFWRKKGATLGMQTWRMELIDLYGNRPDFKTCLKRAFYGSLSFACFGLGYVWCLFDKENRTAHDIFSQTRVIVRPKKPK